jgi:hypothetical protein
MAATWFCEKCSHTLSFCTIPISTKSANTVFIFLLSWAAAHFPLRPLDKNIARRSFEFLCLVFCPIHILCTTYHTIVCSNISVMIVRSVLLLRSAYSCIHFAMSDIIVHVLPHEISDTASSVGCLECKFMDFRKN